MLYQNVAQPLLFSLDPERAHDLLRIGAGVFNYASMQRLVAVPFSVQDSRLKAHVAGIEFPNPIGLAAGFDKNAELVGLLAALGFGALELGTVTARAQPGNPRPRIFRYPHDSALINRMGFPSLGAHEIAARIAHISARGLRLPPLGINIGKSKETPLEEALTDYRTSFELLAPHAAYVVINVSSPNTQGLRQLQERERLSELLSGLREANTLERPILVKISPDMAWPELDGVLECCEEFGIAGIIATNTTVSRAGLRGQSEAQGGLSGVPLRHRSLEVVRYIHQRVGDRIDIIGVGGISSIDSILDMLRAGAQAVQIYTALIYQGPGLVKRLNTELLATMGRLQVSSLTELRSALLDGRSM